MVELISGWWTLRARRKLQTRQANSGKRERANDDNNDNNNNINWSLNYYRLVVFFFFTPRVRSLARVVMTRARARLAPFATTQGTRAGASPLRARENTKSLGGAFSTSTRGKNKNSLFAPQAVT